MKKTTLINGIRFYRYLFTAYTTFMLFSCHNQLFTKLFLVFIRGEDSTFNIPRLIIFEFVFNLSHQSVSFFKVFIKLSIRMEYSACLSLMNILGESKPF